MREIIFRGKRKDNGEWVDGYYVKFVNTHYILTGKIEVENHLDSYGLPCTSTKKHKVIPETIGQYTSLTDKNGTKIFEGDIVNVKTRAYSFKDCKIRYHVDYVRYCFTDKNNMNYPMDKTFEYEVIGNIHDNPELLGGKLNGKL